MLFSEIVGHSSVKSRLQQMVREGRISHAQLFLGSPGSGAFAMALAYAQFLVCLKRKEDDSLQDSCGVCSVCKKFAQLNYPDLHFLYPQSIPESEKENRYLWIQEFKNALLKNPYLSLPDWLEILDVSTQGFIGVHDVEALNGKLYLHAFAGDYKIAIIWMPELMHTAAANKMLKILEEPPEKTIFLLVAENDSTMLPTVKSRTQLIKVPKISASEMKEFLVKRKQVEEGLAQRITQFADGDYNVASKLLAGESGSERIQQIREWLLLCYAMPSKTKELVQWVDQAAKLEREEQKLLLGNTLQVIRDSFLISAGANELVRFDGADREFITKLSQFIHAGNVEKIASSLSDASYHISRNSYDKLTFMNLSLNLGSLLRSKV